jgi:hypothetical protein
VHHYTVFASQDGQALMPVADLPSGTRSFDLASLGLPTANYSFFVKAVGKASILNHMSNAAAFTIGAAIPASPADFALSTSSAALTVTPAQPASVNLQVMPRNGFADHVTFSCTGLPVTAQCSFTPATVSASGTAAVSTTLLVRTTQTASLASMSPLGLASVFLLLSVAAGFTPRRCRYAAAFVVMILAIGLTACGGDGAPQASSAPAGTGAQSSTTSTIVTIIATPSNPATPTKTLQLAVTLR